MPVALERKLKRQVAGKNISEERKNAYVYGTLRKTGWKPDREKKMNNPSKLVRLSEINHSLGSVIEFAYNDEDDKRSLLGTTAKYGAVAGAGAGGAYLGHRVYQTGGLGANLAAGQSAFTRGARGTGLQGITKSPGRAVGKFAGSALAKLRGLFPHMLSSKEETIQFDGHILKPFAHGAVPNSKIIQEEFPAGLSPAAALKFPFPKLMRYLNRPNQLQQRFSKVEKLIEFEKVLTNIIGAPQFTKDQQKRLDTAAKRGGKLFRRKKKKK